MTVALVARIQIVPGKGPEARTLLDKASAISTRLGARNRRFQPIAGGAPGTMTTGNEFDDLAAFGAYVEARAADDEWQAFIQEVTSNPVMQIVQTTLIQEVE